MTTPAIHSNKIDDILTGITPKTPEFAVDAQPEVEPIEAQEVSEGEDTDTKEPEVAEIKPDTEVKAVDKKEEDESDNRLDDYGNPVEKPRVYTEEQVQAMIRDRLSRGRAAEAAIPQAQVQKAAEDFKADPNSEESWEVQLEQFVEKTFDKISTKKQTLAWQQKEQQKQVEFETNFTTGMNKYKDFKEVVGKMPITDSIMMGVRDMADPAAFLFAASKMQPEELRRIAALDDPFAQARELGRLDERMKKARNISNTPPPLKQTKGDMSAKYVPKMSIESKIDQYAKQRRR